MATLNSSTGTDQNPKQERNIAGILFLAIMFAILCAAGVYFVASSHQKLDPYQSSRPESTAPDVKSDAPGDRSGAVAAPQSENVPVPESNPRTQDE